MGIKVYFMVVTQLLLILLSNGINYDNSIRLLQLGDWGGDQNANDQYTTPAQIATANAMGIIGEELYIQGVLALGDNFYYQGIDGACNLDSCSERFNMTFVDVYNSTSLQVPWYVISGNHDWYGNVSAEIEYSKINQNWVYPNFYHKKTLYSNDKSISVDIILIDTILFTGLDVGNAYPQNNVDPVQYNFIVDALKQSKADYILVGGHYPVYSICEHGNTITLINDLIPLFEKYGAHYFSGHDHCAEYFYNNNVAYVLNGMGHGCCYHNISSQDIPEDSLKYFIANTNAAINIDDDNIEVGVNGTVGGFTTIIIDKNVMNITFYNQDGKILYQAEPILPRLYNSNNSNNSNDKVISHQTLIIIISVVVVIFVLIVIVINKTILNGLKVKLAVMRNSLLNNDSIHHDAVISNPMNNN